jgi:hypothetical protein
MFWILVLVFVGGIGYLFGKYQTSEQSVPKMTKAKYSTVNFSFK